MNTSGFASRALAPFTPGFFAFFLGKAIRFPFLTGVDEEESTIKDVNKVQLIGRLGSDPETRYTDKGTALTTFSVATNRTYTTGDNQQTETEWTRVAAWGKLGEIAAQYLGKGGRVYVEGRLRTHTWTDEQTGQQRSSVEVIATDLILLDRRPSIPEPADDEVPF